MYRRLLFVLCCLWATLPGKLFAQQQVNLKTALNEIRAVYGTRFAYEEHLLDNIYVNLKRPLTKKEPVEALLKELLYNKGFIFLYVQENYYTIIKDTRPAKGQDTKPEEVAAGQPTEYVQTITGMVTDKDGHPLVGVTVIPEGYAIRFGSLTSSDGRYTLRLKEKTNAIVFTFVGMTPLKVEVGDKTVINAQLDADVRQLQEVNVVSNGYQSLPKERATGAFEQITGKQIKAVPAVSLMERLEGVAPGVRFDVRNNKISIRGTNTLGAGDGSTPLIVIDGFPAIDQDLVTKGNFPASAGNILNRYNPEDIESITILKDAAATSIWGAKAANGVIVITTKKGKKNSSQLNFSTNLSISNPSNMKNLNRMNSQEYIDLEKEMKDLGFFSDPIKWDNSWMTFNQNKPVSEAVEWMFKVDRGTATAAQRDSALAALGKTDNRSQIRDLLLQRSVSQQYNLSFSGGGQHSTYYLSTNYTRDIPVLRSNKAESFFVTANLSNELFNNRVTINTGINYNFGNSVSNTAAVNAIGSGPLALRPYELLADAAGNPIARSIDFRDEVTADFLSKGYLPWTYSALQELNYGNTTSKSNRYRLTTDIVTKITDWMNVSVAGSLQRNLAESINLNELNSYDTRSLVNTGTTIGSNGKLVYGVPYGGKMTSNNRTDVSYGLRAQVNVNKTISPIFTLNALAGTEIRENKGTGYQQTRYGFDGDTYASAAWNPTTSYMTVMGWTTNLGYSDGSINRGINRFLSYYGNGALSILNNRYTVSGSVRFDDFSLAGATRSQRARPLWSSGVKWNVTSEDFLKPSAWLNNLNLRVTYGTGGAVPTSASNAAVLNPGGIDPNTGEPSGSVFSPANNKISWELTRTWNLGVDMDLLNNRLHISADAYTKKTSDILWQFPVNSTYGWSDLMYNAASMKGHGYDVGIRGDIIRNAAITWTSTFNFAYNTNEVTDSRFKRPTSSTAVNSGTPIVGMPKDFLLAYRWAGLDNKGRSQVYTADGKIVNADMPNSSITADDLVYMGRTTPPYFGGFFNDFSYKAFTFGVRITYEMGHVFRRLSIQNYPDYQTNNYIGLIGTQRDLALRWRKPGDEQFTNVPGLANVSTNSSNRYKMSDILVESASHIRLQQIAMGYQVPSRLLSRMMVKSVSANLAVRNLGLIWKQNKAGLDPSYTQTNSYTNLPPATSYFFSLNASF
ncbi:TonB-linked SusC/RagA family outer membrane protein [Chitinophaga terrae (ex Kim and Jung 2007)]|uniref:SusC/RagA family TonB-linked outer membrane protein n=1 Tax=Chitinophaga terrae (ex Kim and Jung 2007) TaxID=408074 RepID=UPI0027816A7B|nr:SusC/RagA family TonB-linked outer membrane protein [Chitinophaga terrae (ex Kim and Jung 2007)]MDQ0107248.1 TonB-linked SusC/RagA family outer membrane protein [Chitinophaga terrae (ex Kim and Jung 2007)]